MNFCVVNLGCKVNRVESDAFVLQLLRAGGTETREEDAQLIVVNTCTVTGEAEKKTRKAVRHALRANDTARVVVTGCAAAIDAATYTAMSERVRVISKAEIAALLEDYAREYAVVQARNSAGLRIRRGVKVQDGCNNACTYCIVHVARGKAHSRASADIRAEARELATAGVKEIVLTGINLGSYCEGEKRDPHALRLAGLLELLLADTANVPDGAPPRFRISSIEPRDVDDDLIALLARANGRVCRHLHLPLQAGSNKVLREMARPYSKEFFLNLVNNLRKRVPAISLSTDIIVGFPGETEQDFQETLDVVRACAFSKIHVFPYSRREGTPAAARSDQIPPETKAARAQTLRDVSDELREADRAARAGTTEWAVVEPGGTMTTESYHEIAAPVAANCGELVLAAFPVLQSRL